MDMTPVLIAGDVRLLTVVYCLNYCGVLLKSPGTRST